MATRLAFLTALVVSLALARGAIAQVIAPPLAATTVQLPTFGVAIDAEGVLTVKTFEDPTGQVHAAQLQAAKGKLPANLQARSPLRKVSLVRLEAALRRELDAGQQPDDSLRYLAGLERIQYVFYLPEQRDIVIAGPAEGFAPDPSGRVCGISSGRPTLRLDDLVVALRAFAVGQPPVPFIGCTIDPTKEALTRLRDFQKTVPHVIPEASRAEVGRQIATGMRDALGTAPIRVFGISAQTHFAQVLVEADYRMKLIGIGLEQPPVRLTSFWDVAGGAKQNILERWWFTPNYDCVKVSKDRQAMELVGQGVQLLTEAKFIAAGGDLKATPVENRASETFTKGFTQKYPELAARSPVFAELRNLIDMLVAAAFIRQAGYAEQAGWKMETLGGEKTLPVETSSAPTLVACPLNAAWRGARFVALAGGGVSIQAEQALDAKRVFPDKDGQLSRTRGDAIARPPADRWWWD